MLGGIGPQYLGADYHWAFDAVPIAAPGDQIVPADPCRVALLFAVGHYSGSGLVQPIPNSDQNVGIACPPQGYLEFVWHMHGPLVCSAWYSADGNGGVPLTVATVRYVPVSGE